VFLNVNSKEAQTASGKCVILARVFKGNKEYADEKQKKRAYISDFKKRFDRVIMLDDGAGSDSLHFEYMDLVDLYYKGKLLRDKSNYLRPMYGRQIFADYYHKKFGISDEKVKMREKPDDPSLLNKLRVSWNLGCGLYPIPQQNFIKIARATTKFGLAKILKPWFTHQYKKMISQISSQVDLHNKARKVQARFGSNSLPNSIGYQRKVFTQKCASSQLVLNGSIDAKAYNKEVKSVATVLSPFGWGEICFRDFEAVTNGCLLIKPSMDHIETWPDLFISGKTYVPVDWDGENLVETINSVAKNIAAYSDVILFAKEEYKKALLNIDNRVQHFLEEASGIRIDKLFYQLNESA
jgi:hypothetical protein